MAQIGELTRTRAHWDDLQEAMIEAMVRLEKALRPHLKDLPPA